MLVFASLTEELQHGLEHTQPDAAQQLTDVVAQGMLETPSWLNLARKEYGIDIVEARALREECDVV